MKYLMIDDDASTEMNNIMSNQKEATARIKINKLLEESGWRFFADKNGKQNIQLETNVKWDDLENGDRKTGTATIL